MTQIPPTPSEACLKMSLKFLELKETTVFFSVSTMSVDSSSNCFCRYSAPLSVLGYVLEKLTPNLRNPLITTTYGTGELINAALDRGVEKIILGIGGSATNDGGMGVAQALGVKFLNELGEPLKHGGGQLHMLRDIDLTGIDSRLKDVEIVVACDVDNPLCGKDGASFVFSPQKGANELMAKQLDDGLYHYAEVIHNKMGIDIRDIKGSGAAGGLGGGAIAFLGATLRSGIDIVTDAVGLEREIKDSDRLCCVIRTENQIARKLSNY